MLRVTLRLLILVIVLKGNPAKAGILNNRPAKAPHPNIVVILADDAGWGDLSINGNPYLSTPSLDKLAASGAQFRNFFVSPLCAPTRASLLTGRYHLRTGTAYVTSGLETMRSEEVTIAEIFKAVGYSTGIFGKWHNGAHYPQNPLGQGFDEFMGFCGGHWTNYFNTQLEHNGKMVPTQGYITDVLADAAIDFIGSRKGKPFLCYIPFNAPHAPYQLPDRYFDKFKAKGLSDKDAAVYGMVENMDENIGRVLGELKRLNLEENTIVVFLTDNGPNGERYNGRMKGIKASVNEGGVRVPMFIRWPGTIKAGTVVDDIAGHIDILPTLAELAGVTIPVAKPIDGKSLVPLLQNRSGTSWPERMLFTHTMGNDDKGKVMRYRGAIRSSQYRFITAESKDELYDMLADPEQRNELGGLYPGKLKDFRKMYDSWFADVTREGIRPEITELGYPQAPEITLFTPDATLSGSVRYYGGNGYVHDWAAGWTSSADMAVWNVKVVNPGKYSVRVFYNAPETAVGSSIQAVIGGNILSRPISKAFSGTFTRSPNRAPDQGVPEKDWAELSLGSTILKKGNNVLQLRRSGNSLNGELEIKQIILEQLKEK